MNRRYLHILLLLALTSVGANAQDMDTLIASGPSDRALLTRHNPKFIAAKVGVGQVFRTNTFVQGNNAIPLYGSASFKFGLNSRGDCWEDMAYGMPYYGFGLYLADLGRRNNLGLPYSVYLLQGATLFDFTPRFRLNYEWNLGASMGWKPYDPFTNPDNVAVGSSVNVHVGLNFYLKYITHSGIDLHLGVEATHFSNGASRMPNKGLNLGAVYVEMAYNFNGKKESKKEELCPQPPVHKPYYASEFLVNISSRQIYVDTTNTNLPDEVLGRKFKVLGVTYSLMRVPTYRYRYGLSADFLYDESSGVAAWREQNPANGKFYDRVKLGPVGDRFSLGLSVKGEVVLPGYTMFAHMGYSIFHGNKKDNRFYQIIGAKVYLKENFFATFGIRASYFSRAQFLYWSLGYTLEHHNTNRIFRRHRRS